MKKASQQHRHIFYQKLGFLFYSIAAADKIIREEEIKELHKEVVENWVNLEDSKDEFGSDAAYQIETVFDWILDNETNGERAYQIFESYFLENSEMFDAEIKKKIYSTSNKISLSYHGVNKAEASNILRLHTLLG